MRLQWQYITAIQLLQEYITWECAGVHEGMEHLTPKLVGVSLSRPHINHDNGPRARNNGMSVSFTPRLSHPGSWGLCTPWNASCIPVYWSAHVHDLQLHALDWTAKKTRAAHVCHEDYSWQEHCNIQLQIYVKHQANLYNNTRISLASLVTNGHVFMLCSDRDEATATQFVWNCCIWFPISDNCKH